MKTTELFPEQIKDYGDSFYKKRFFKNFPIERPSRSRRARYYDSYYNKTPEQPKPKPIPKPPKQVIDNKFVLQKLKAVYYGRIYGEFLISTGEVVEMPMKSHLVVDYINTKSSGDKTIFVLGPNDQLFLDKGEEYQRYCARADNIRSKNLIPGCVYWSASVEHWRGPIKESLQLYLGKIKMTGTSRRKYEMVDVWYDVSAGTFSRYQQPKKIVSKFAEPDSSTVGDLRQRAEAVLVKS